MKSLNAVFILLMLIPCSVASCKRAEMTLKELRSYAQQDKNGLKKVSKLEQGLVIETYFLRPELLQFTGHMSAIKQLSDSLLYMMISISRNGREAIASANPDRYGTLINNLSFNAGTYIKLTSGKDTLPMLNSAFSNTYGTSSANNILLVFKDSKSDSPEYRLEITEMGFNSGTVEVDFDKEAVLKFNKIEVKK